jgi:hypothetical protein
MCTMYSITHVSLKVMWSRCSIFVFFSLVLLVGQVDSGPPANQLLKLVIQEARYTDGVEERDRQGDGTPSPPRSYQPVLIFAVFELCSIRPRYFHTILESVIQ